MDRTYKKYQNKIPYPKIIDFTTLHIYQGGIVLYSGPEDKKPPNVSGVVERTIDKEALQAARQAYGAETARLIQLFQDDLFEEYGVTDNPKRFKAYDLAWEHGHSSGLSEVVSFFEDLVDLIKD